MAWGLGCRCIEISTFELVIARPDGTGGKVPVCDTDATQGPGFGSEAHLNIVGTHDPGSLKLGDDYSMVSPV